MKFVRMIAWLLLLAALLVFSVANWEPAITVKIWENLVVETKIPAIVVVSFLIGFVPMWLIYRASRWQLTRRIGSLEASARASAAPPPTPASELDPDTALPRKPAPPIL